MTRLDALPERTWGIRVGGKEVDPASDRSLDRTMPGRPERKVGRFRFAGPSDVGRAVATVREAQREWADLRPKERGETLLRAAGLLRERGDELAAWECLEAGMLVGLARDHARWCAELLEFYAGLGRDLSGRTVDLGGSKLGLTVPEPFPVVAALGPWNFPLSELIWKVAPALAAGCGVIMKPSELTPVSSFILDEVLHEAGVPVGLTAVLTGDREVGGALIGHPGVAMVSLTGGVETGRAVLRAAAERVVPTLMELGGKSAIVVLPDADPEQAAAVAAPGVLFRTGQACTCPSRIVVVGGTARAHGIAEAIEARFAVQRLGPPDDEEVSVGPAIHSGHAEGVRAVLAAAAARGAVLVAPGDEPGEEYLAPTVILDASPEDPVVTDEVFGPVTAVLEAGTLEEAVTVANGTRYGLAAGVVSGGDLDAALGVARRLFAGSVWIDEWGTIELELPFGGMGESGFGRELGKEGLEAFVTWKSIHLPHRAIEGREDAS
ncbi:MAG: aldehyde dehydrogenase [Actinobacteria bacterium]|nr:aldehyde dehydrogenase [Actinomycetota bacterium]